MYLKIVYFRFISALRLNTDLERFGRDNRPKHPFQDDSAWYLRFPTRDFERVRATIKNGDMTSLKFAFNNGYPVDTQDRFYKTALVSHPIKIFKKSYTKILYCI